MRWGRNSKEKGREKMGNIFYDGEEIQIKKKRSGVKKKRSLNYINPCLFIFKNNSSKGGYRTALKGGTEQL